MLKTRVNHSIKTLKQEGLKRFTRRKESPTCYTAVSTAFSCFALALIDIASVYRYAIITMQYAYWLFAAL